MRNNILRKLNSGFRTFLVVLMIVGLNLGTASAVVATSGTPGPCSVTNTATSVSSPSIPVAIGSASPGDTLNVSGTCSLSININKSLTLHGMPGSAIIATGGVTAITVSADNVTIDNLVITKSGSPVSNGIVATDQSNLTITNNNISNFLQGILILGSPAGGTDITNINISGNTISNISYTGTSAKAIAVGWSNSSRNVTGLIINNNQLSDVSSTKGAYGILINNGVYSTGQTIGARITNNTISNLNGSWAHGVGLEGDTPSAVVTGNVISQLNFPGVPSDATGVKLEDNPSVASVLIKNNQFSDMTIGVINSMSPTPAYRVNARHNWWGNVNGPLDPIPGDASIFETNAGTGVAVFGAVDYRYWEKPNVVPTMSNLKIFVKDSSGNYNPSSFVKRGDLVRIEVDATDTGSGIKDVEFRIQALAGDYVASRDWINTPVGDTYRFEFQVPTDGRYVNTHSPMNEDLNGHTVWARATDNAGNYNNGISTNFTFDNTVPQMSNLKMFVKDSSGSYVSSLLVKNDDMVRIEVDSTDMSSGIKNVEFRIKNAGGGGYITSRVWVNTPVSGDTYQFDFQVPTDGEYIDTHVPINELIDGNSSWVRATDNAGNYFNGLTKLFTYDNTAPSVPVLTSPIGFTNDNTPLMQWDDSTDINGISGYYYRVYYNCSDESNIPASCTSVYPNATGLWRTMSEYQAGTTNDGTYFWQVKAQDNAGNQSAWSGLEKVVIDIVAPAKPADLQRVLGSDHSIVYACGAYSPIQTMHPDWADNTEDDFAYYEYTSFNAGGGIGINERTFYDSIFEYHGSWLPGEGTYGFAVRAVDKAGNVSDWALTSKTLAGSCQITYDNTAPTATIDSVELIATSGTYYSTEWKVNDNTPTIVGTATDSNGVASVVVNVNGNDYTAVVTGSDWKVDVTDMLPDGIHTITATVLDEAGNITVANQDITIDTIAPTADYSYYKNGTLITDTTAITYVQNISELTFDGTATDANPSAGLLYDSFVIFQAQDDGSFGFSRNGKLAYCSWRSAPNLVNFDGTNSFTIGSPVNLSDCTATLGDGEYYLTHQVYDEAVRQDIPSIHQFRDVLGVHFVVDSTPPVITWVTPLDGYGPLAGNVPLSVTCDGTDGDCDYINFWWWSSDQTILDAIANGQYHYERTDGTAFSWTLNSLAPELTSGETGEQLDGEYTLRAAGKDLAGNYTHEQITVTFDNTAPVTSELTSPVTASFWGAPITITAKTVDPKPSPSSPNGVDFVNIYYRLAGATAFLPADVLPLVDNLVNNSPFAWTTNWTPPAEGSYDIKVAGVDMAGNEESSVYAYNVTYDVSAPTIVNAGPDRGNQSAPFSQTGNATDTNSGIAGTVWSQTSGPGTVFATDINALATSFSADVAGSYVVRLTATDNAGNSASDEFTFNWVIDTGTTLPATTPPPANTPATPNTPLPLTTGGNNNVLGDTTTNPTTDSNNDVLGETTSNLVAEARKASTNKDESRTAQAGNRLSNWYWWWVIVVALGIAGYLYMKYGKNKDKKSEKK